MVQINDSIGITLASEAKEVPWVSHRSRSRSVGSERDTVEFKKAAVIGTASRCPNQTYFVFMPRGGGNCGKRRSRRNSPTLSSPVNGKHPDLAASNREITRHIHESTDGISADAGGTIASQKSNANFLTGNKAIPNGHAPNSTGENDERGGL